MGFSRDNNLISFLSHIFASSGRTRKAQVNIVGMLLIKGCNILINLAYVPLLINSLNQDRYGIWLTITTIVSWIAFFDIGLGNGLRNKLAESVAGNDIENARKYVSTTYGTMGLLCLSFILVELCVVPFCNWNNLLNAQTVSNEELTILMLWVLSSLGLQILLKLLNSVLYALQKPALSSLILMLSQLFAFIGVLIYTHVSTNVSLLKLGCIISLAPIVVLMVFSLVLFHFVMPQFAPRIAYFDRTKIKEIVILGTKFFWIQITALLLFQSNNLIIAHTCGSAAVAEYNIAYKYIGLIEMVFMIVMTPFWSAATEAYTKKDYLWIKNILRKLRYISYCLIGVGVVLIALSDLAYDWWLSSSIVPDKVLLCLLLLYFCIQLSWARFGSIINGIGYIKLQFYVTMAEALIHIPLALLLGSYWGIKGVIVSLIVSTFANTIWPQIQIKNIFLGKQGIWVK